MNLLIEPYLLVKCVSGKNEFIAPYQITDNYKSDPIVTLITPRPDFKGALMQFLIGVLQLAYTDIKSYQWNTLRENPPTPEQLKEKLLFYAKAFEVNTDGPCFMQDLNLTEGEFKPIGSLLIEQPGENTLRDNKDHFIKRGQVEALCPLCAVTALFTLQLNAPSGGAGHRTSIRGGGPLTTLVLEEPKADKVPTLWQNLWLNVLSNKFKPIEIDNLQSVFPWLAPTRTSENKTGTMTIINDVHPLQMYWAMPRRIRLNFNNTVRGECDICGTYADKLLTQYMTKNYGINYTGIWKHPLSPYIKKAEGEFIPMHPQPGGIGYKYWQALAIGTEGNNTKEPAAVVAALIDGENDRCSSESQLQIWAFGYDMDNMKARCWYDSYLPFYHIDSDLLSDLQMGVENLIKAAELTLGFTKSAVKQTDGDTSRLGTLFWQQTERSFYKCIEEIIQALKNRQSFSHIYEKWWGCLFQDSLRLFEITALAGLKKKAEQHKALKGNLIIKLRSVLKLSSLKEELNAKEIKDAITG